MSPQRLREAALVLSAVACNRGMLVDEAADLLVDIQHRGHAVDLARRAIGVASAQGLRSHETRAEAEADVRTRRP